MPPLPAATESPAQATVEASRDGIERHSANRYPLDQFLQDNANKRTDVYGG
jgi:N-ethylmaleimide reductase